MAEGNEIRIDNNPDEILKDITKKFKKNPWMISTIVLGIVAVIVLIMGGSLPGVGTKVSAEEAGQKMIDFAVAQGAQASLVEVNEKGDFYEVVLSMQGQELPLYVTKDGEYFSRALIPFAPQGIPNTSQTQQPPADVPKSDKPVVELFVMTHCPYGTQAEKGYLPVLELLGDKIDSSVKFVHYFLHDPEEAETPIQVCIREEQGAKFNNYLACFLEDGDSNRCLTAVGIDQTKLNSCKTGKADDYYAIDSALSKGYGVRGSPTLLVNGQIVESGRSPAAYLSTICNAFNEAPEECSEVLNSASPSPGFGYTASAGGSTNAQC